jgi:histone acetyltransferase (RNA polymerase elongator complex component)
MAKHEHANIPIFIPHLGCPNDCVFCNQRTISGHGDFDPSAVRGEIETALATLGDRQAEIAFFGGSFTGIDRSLMISLLDTAQEYVDAGRVCGIRLSTRPDYIDGEIIDILSRYTVAAVELGIQSTDDRVLTASRRGHTAAQTEAACAAIRAAGLTLVGQMMIGLPESSPESEIKTARDICRMGATAARVYPTVVFKKTALCRMAQGGEYAPLTDAEAAARAARVLDVFDKCGVRVIRVGLCASENLSSEDEVYGGASHPAVGEMAMSELYFSRICEAVDALPKAPESLVIYVAPGATSKATGQKRANICRLCEKYGINRVKILEKNDIIGYNIILEYN